MNKQSLTNSLWKKLIWTGVVIVLYFVVWRPIRGGLLTLVTNPIIENFQETHRTDLKIRQFNSLSLYVEFQDAHNYKDFMFKIAGGSFFLFGIIGLIFLSDKPFDLFLPYFLLQIGLIILTILFLWIGLFYWTVGIQIVDWFGRYLEPLINLGFVVINANFVKLKKV